MTAAGIDQDSLSHFTESYNSHSRYHAKTRKPNLHVARLGGRGGLTAHHRPSVALIYLNQHCKLQHRVLGAVAAWQPGVGLQRLC